MNESEALSKMISPGMQRPGKPLGGVIQIWVTRACDKACFGCTQGSNLAGKPGMITPEQFEQACLSLRDYFGVVGMFGGNPAVHPQFEELCEIMQRHIPYERRGLWCNNLLGKGAIARKTFNPSVSNLNVHLDQAAYDEFKRDWPESMPFGLTQDSRHSPVYVSMRDVGVPEEKRWELISNCDINQQWSAMIGLFRGELRAWFCEIAGAQAMLHQHEPDYPDTGCRIDENGMTWDDDGPYPWWSMTMQGFSGQVAEHCHNCGVPLRGYGSLAQDETAGVEQVSQTHESVYKPKRKDRALQVVTREEELGEKHLKRFTDYLQNGNK